MTEDPWDSLERPDASNSLNARRVSAEHRWNFFWGRDLDGRCLLFLQHDGKCRTKRRLPSLRGLDVTETDPGNGRDLLLAIRLQENTQRELFYRLCLDIIACAASAESEKDAVELTVTRTWRWHHLLRGGQDDRLSPEQQKGLIGELLILENHLAPRIGAVASVNAWEGPLNAPKDFELGHTFLEVKTRRSGSAPFVKISSEDQLDAPDSAHLFLFVVDLNSAMPEDGDAFTLTDVASRVRQTFESVDQIAVDLLEQRLFSAGFLWAHDYSNSPWLEGESSFYQVREGFPRIVSSQLAGGIEKVGYNLSLDACQPYRCDPDQLYQLISGSTDGDYT
ncbi:MAG: PD-(D/E)XK motif protein [Planctomycetota bacterium]